MKRCSPLLARVQRLPLRDARSAATRVAWRRHAPSCLSNSCLDISAGSPRRRPPVTAFAGIRLTETRGFGSQATKTPVRAEDFEALKQFLMKPSTEGDAAEDAKAIVTAMMDAHVYAAMSGQEAAVMSMVADALEDYAFVVDVYKCLRGAQVAPSPVTLELTAEACAHTGDWRTAQDVLDQMHRAVELMHPSIDIYENAVRACLTANKWMQAKQLLEALRNDGLEASPEIHVEVIETCLVSRELTATKRLVDEFLREFPMLEEDEVCDVFHGLLALALDHGVLDHALYVRDQLAQRGVEIPRETYEQLLALSARQGKWHSARVLLAQLTNARALPVSAPSYAFTRDTAQLLEDMHAHGLEISRDVYNAALRAYGGQTKLARAEGLLATMKQRGVTPDTVSYAAVICSCGTDIEASQRYFDELREQGLPLSMDAFHVYLLAPSRAKQWEHVLERYKTIRKLATDDERKQISHDARIMACVATAHGNLENDDEMLRVFTGMKVNGLVPNLYVYAEAMKAYTRKGQWRHALMLFDHLWTEGIDKDKLSQFPLTWDAAVEAAITGDDTERLEMLYQQVTKQHGRLRPHTAATLIDAMTNIPTDKIWNDFRPIKYIHERRNADPDSQLSWQVVNAVLKRAVSEWDAPLAEKVVREAQSELGMRNFNAMTYSLMLELYARKKEHDKFLEWCTHMADADSKVTAYTTRALLSHLRTLAEDEDAPAIRKFADAAARVFSVDRDRRVDVRFTPFFDAAELGRKILDIWEVRGNAIHTPALEEYIGLCRSSIDLEDVFQRLDRQADRDQPLTITPEFVHAFFLSVAEMAQELQPRLRDFLIECLETQPKESARAALGVFCSISPSEEILELFKALVDENEDGEIEDDELVIFLASCAGDAGGDDGTLAVDVDQLREICAIIDENEMSLGAGSITFLLRTVLTLARTQSTASSSPQGEETVDLVKSLLASALEGSSREELRAFIEEISHDSRDIAHIDAILELV